MRRDLRKKKDGFFTGVLCLEWKTWKLRGWILGGDGNCDGRHYYFYCFFMGMYGGRLVRG